MERDELETLEQAVSWVVQTNRVMNHNYMRRDEVTIVDQPPLGPRIVTVKDEDTLDRIARGELVVLSFNDKRILYRITDEECEFILTRREYPVC